MVPSARRCVSVRGKCGHLFLDSRAAAISLGVLKIGEPEETLRHASTLCAHSGRSLNGILGIIPSIIPGRGPELLRLFWAPPGILWLFYCTDTNKRAANLMISAESAGVTGRN